MRQLRSATAVAAAAAVTACWAASLLLVVAQTTPAAPADDEGPLVLNPIDGEGSRNCTTKDGRLGTCIEYTRCYQNYSIIKYGEPDAFELRDSNCIGLEWCCADDILTEEEIRDGTKRRPGVDATPGPGRQNATTMGTQTVNNTQAGNMTADFRSGLGCGIPTDGFRDASARPNTMQYGECPWCVAIFRDGGHPRTKSSSGYFCSGALIHPRVVLTAAVCTLMARGSRVWVHVGDYDLANTTELFQHQTLQVEDMLTHEDYKSGTQHNNIALLFLGGAAELGYNVNTACLPGGAAPPRAPTCAAGGWGRDRAGRYQDVLAKVQVSPVDRAGCQRTYREKGASKGYTVGESAFCAEGSADADLCPAHYGAPLQCLPEKEISRYVVYGLNSWTLACSGVPAVFTDVRAFTAWVDRSLAARGHDTKSYTI